MVKLYVYDASIVNTSRCPDYYSLDDDPVTQGLRRGLARIKPPNPFLLRGLFGDYEQGEKYKLVIKPTFDGRNLETLLSHVLEQGHDRVNERNERKEVVHPYEVELHGKGVAYSDMLWAAKCDSVQKAEPYRFFDDMGMHMQGRINDFTLVLDRRSYVAADRSEILFYQKSKELRQRALLGIIISETQPRKRKKKSLSFDLRPENLAKVLRRLGEQGYFQ